MWLPSHLLQERRNHLRSGAPRLGSRESFQTPACHSPSRPARAKRDGQGHDSARRPVRVSPGMGGLGSYHNMDTLDDGIPQASRSANAKIEDASAGADLDQALADRIALAEVAINPFLPSAKIAAAFARGASGQADCAAIAVALSQNFRDIAAGDMRRPEAMLYSQAVALQTIFALLAQRAMGTNCVPRCNEPTLALALKCQAQSRATLETLGELVNPRSATFVQQANVAGQQLVQNMSTARADQGKISTPSNQLLSEDNNRETLEPGRTKPAIEIDPQLAAVAQEHRADNHRRQGPQLPEQLQARRAIRRLAGDGQAAGHGSAGVPAIHPGMPGTQPGGLKVSGDEAERLDRLISELPAPKI